MIARDNADGTLPVRLHPYDDEWLPAAINRWAWYVFDSPPADLYAALGLADLHPNEVRALGNSIQPQSLHSIRIATGISAVRLRGMTLSRYNGRALQLRLTANRLHSIRSDFTWVRRAGTRFCPKCLAERPGVFPMHWRFNWTFVCLTHRRILSDVCPGCGLELVEPYGQLTRARDPNRCSRRIRNAENDFYCDSVLDRSDPDAVLPTQSPILRAQRFVNAILQRATDPSSVLRDLASTMASVRSAAPIDVVAQLAELKADSLLGLIVPETRAGASPPSDALSFAALAAAAVRLRNDPEDDVSRFLREITFNRPPAHAPRGAGLGPGSANELLGLWGRLRDPMTSRVLRAIDSDLSPVARIRTHSAVSTPDVQEVIRHTPIANSAAMATIPRRLWASWTVPLYLDHGSNIETVAGAFAAALDVNSRVPNLRETLIGVGDERERIVHSLAILRMQLSKRGTAIDYERRRVLPWQRFLPDTAWTELCEEIGADPGIGRRAVLARRYMYMRLTGDGPQGLPAEFRRQRRDDTAQETMFLLRLTADLQRAMDAYARFFFEKEECEMLWEHAYSPTMLTTEPLVWAPKRSEMVKDSAVARELDDIQLHKLHTMLADGVGSLTRISTELRRTVAHIKLAIDAWPPPIGPSGSRENW